MGIIGAGKSTLTGKLAEYLGYDAHYEPVKENVYLTDFYKDPARWGAMMQIYLLAKRFAQHQEIVWSGKGKAIQDRTIYEDTIFAEMLYEDGLISERDYDTYISHFNVMKRYLVYPDLVIFLDVKPEVAMERIMSRGRTMENEMELEYLKKLDAGYRKFISEIGRWTRVVTIDYNRFLTTEEVIEQLKGELDDDTRYKRALCQI